MDAELVNGFINSAHDVLQAEVGAPVKIGQVSVQKDGYTCQQVTAVIGVAGNIQGVMMFGLSEETAKQVVSRMMGQEIGSLDELAQSGIAEMGNVIAGAAATNLSATGHYCTISPPALIFGNGMTISTLSIPRLVIPLLTPCGLVEMQLALKVDVVPRQAALAGPAARR